MFGGESILFFVSSAAGAKEEFSRFFVKRLKTASREEKEKASGEKREWYNAKDERSRFSGEGVTQAVNVGGFCTEKRDERSGTAPSN